MAEKFVPISMNRILVAADGSKHSEKAIEMAIDLAKKWDAAIYLIHVLKGEMVPEGFLEFAKIEKVDTSEYFGWACNKDNFMGKAETKIREAGIKKVERICDRGDPADMIVSAAERNKVDMIVMGSRGLGGFSRTIMGSVSTKVCNRAHCTVVVVK